MTATNNSFDEQTVDLESTTDNHLDVVSATGATKVNKNLVRKDDVTLAAATVGVPSVDPGELFGYIPLDAFGITPIAVGDEDVLNFNVPAYLYNGVTYSAIGVDSNGYAIAGGGTSEDNNCCNIPGGIRPGRPNNVARPVLDRPRRHRRSRHLRRDPDGRRRHWLVIEWRGQRVRDDQQPDVPDVDRRQRRPGHHLRLRSRQSAGRSERSGLRLRRREPARPGRGHPETLPTEDQRVTSTDPTPGGSYTYSVTIKGTKVGDGVFTSSMTGDGLLGTTIVKTDVTVTH